MPSKVRYVFTDASGVYHGARAIARLKAHGEGYGRRMDTAHGSVAKQAERLMRDLRALGVGGIHMKILRERRGVLAKRSRYKTGFPVLGRAPEQPRRRRPEQLMWAREVVQAPPAQPAGYAQALEEQVPPAQAPDPLRNFANYFNPGGRLRRP